MIKFLLILICLVILNLFTPVAWANTNSFVSVVNPVRGSDFWDTKDQLIDKAVRGQVEVLRKYNVPGTYLLRFDVLGQSDLINFLKENSNDLGLFLEITPTWTQAASVDYHKSDSWHHAGSAFLSGYERGEREKLIDTAFEKFKEIFGGYPKSVGAWWIDAYTLSYMQQKYGILTALIVADQYSTDKYQIWGQYFGTPFYPAKNNALHPTQSLDNKIPIVITQWASRDPVNGYGSSVEESTYSVQVNDYIDYHQLDINYFSKLLDIYTKQKFNQFGHLVIGLENSYWWEKYAQEYENQIKLVSERRSLNKLNLTTLSDFATWYKSAFPSLSPPHVIVADDPLGSLRKVVWFMNPYYRAGWFINHDGSVFRDIRQYVVGEEELCFQKRCDEVNFATFATRVLDEVSFNQKWVVDEGRIDNFKIEKVGERFLISYTNEAGKQRTIEFLLKDISVDGKNYSIDGAILEATKLGLGETEGKFQLEEGFFKWSPLSASFKIIKFAIFLLLVGFIPGFLLIKKIAKNNFSPLQIFFLSGVIGIVLFATLFYILSLLKIRPLIFVYILIILLLFIKIYRRNFKIPKIRLGRLDLLILAIIIIGTIFQTIPTFKNGLIFPYGIGLWGPNTHDGLWHVALINQLIKDVPPQNPVLSGEILKNYHYFYNLLLAATNYLTSIPVLDLVFRFYPLIFSLLLGIGSYYLIKNLFPNKWAAIFGLYLVYFSGSFGWIVEIIKSRGFGGESNFWANQSISFNLNPPFAISLVIVIAIFLLLIQSLKASKSTILVLILLCGTLISFKAYAGFLVLMSLLLAGLIKRSLYHLTIFIGSLIISGLLFISNFSLNTQLMIYSPFWFIHSMVDSMDRVGWERLSLARETGFSQGNWFKFLSAEAISLFMFIFGNLGMRFFALLSLFKFKKIFQQTEPLFLFIFSLLAFLIPIFFIQAGNPWNTIQFLYYYLYVSAVVGGIVVSAIITKVNKVLAIFLILIFAILTPINSWATANGYLSYQPHGRISIKELEALEFLASKEDGIILTYPYDKNLKKRLSEPWPMYAYDSTSYVSALTNKASFLEDEAQNQILLTDYKKRLIASKDFFRIQGPNEREFLRDNNIKYIYIPKIYNLRLNEEDLNIENIFENEELIVYEVR